MKVVIGTVAVAAALVVAGAAAGHAAPQSTTTATTASSRATSLDARVSKKLNADPSLKHYDIKVSSDHSVVILTGTVPTAADRSRAARLAKIDGVTRVDNQITVDRNAGTAGTTGTVEHGVDKGADKTKQGISKGAEKSEEGIDKAKSGVKTGYEKSKEATVKAAGKTEEVVGKGVSKGAEGTAKGLDKAAEGVSKAGEAITDGLVTGRVKSKFTGEDALKGSDIHVDTDDHVVTLSGTVQTAAGRARAVELAKTVDGVTRVIDKLTIGPKRPE